MERRKFGNTGPTVSAIGLDCAHIPAGGKALELIRLAYERGITFFNVGNTHESLTQFLNGGMARRDQLEIGSAFSCEHDFSPASIRAALERSLQLMATDYVDVYLAEHLKLPQFRDDAFAELEKLKCQGKVRLWGVSLGPEIGWREEGLRAIHDYHANAVQSAFNLFEQDPGRELCEMAVATGAGVVARVGVDDHRGRTSINRRKIELVQPCAAEHGMTVQQFCLKWLLQQKGLTSISAALRDEREIVEACGAVGKPNLPRAVLDQIARDYARDWDLGPDAHPRDLMSSVAPGGRLRSSYVPPPVLMA